MLLNSYMVDESFLVIFLSNLPKICDIIRFTKHEYLKIYIAWSISRNSFNNIFNSHIYFVTNSQRFIIKIFLWIQYFHDVESENIFDFLDFSLSTTCLQVQLSVHLQSSTSLELRLFLLLSYEYRSVLYLVIQIPLFNFLQPSSNILSLFLLPIGGFTHCPLMWWKRFICSY